MSDGAESKEVANDEAEGEEVGDPAGPSPEELQRIADIWVKFHEALPTEPSKEDRQRRDNLFQQFNEGDTAYLGLPDLEAGILDITGCAEIWNPKLAIESAHQYIRTVVPDGSSDQLDFSEFRLLLTYVKKFAKIHQICMLVDHTQDKELTLEMMEAARPHLDSAGIVVEHAEALWDQLRNEHAAASVDSLAEWYAKQGLAGTELLEEDQQVQLISSFGPNANLSAAAQFIASARIAKTPSEELFSRNPPPEAILDYMQADCVEPTILERMLLQKRPDKNMRKKTFGWSPLLFAAHGGKVEILKLLLAAKAEARTLCKQHNSILHLAARSGHKDAVGYILAKASGGKGASINATNGSGWTPLTLAVMNGHVDVVDLLIKANATITVPDNEGRTLGMWAARHGHVEILSTLLSYGLDLYAKDKSGKSVSDYAQDHMDMRMALLDKEKINFAVLNAAQRKSIPEMQEAIKAKANVDAKDECGWTALTWAFMHRSLGLVKVLAQNNADPSFVRASSAVIKDLDLGPERDVLEETLAHSLGTHVRALVAARAAEWELVENELSDGAHVNAQEKDTLLSCLMFAAVHTAIDATVMLVGKCANLEQRDAVGMTALHFAVQSGSVELVSVLHFLRADFSTKTYEGQSALHIAARIDDAAMVQLLAAARCDLDVASSEGDAPAQFAAKWGCAASCRTLLTCKADAGMKDHNGRDLLMIAVTHGHEPVLQELLHPSCPPPPIGSDHALKHEEGHFTLIRTAEECREQWLEQTPTAHSSASLLSKDEDMRTALHLAVLHHRTELVPILLEHKAALDPADSSGNTPLLLAAGCGNFQVFGLLLAAGASDQTRNAADQSLEELAPTPAMRELMHRRVIERKLPGTKADSALQPAEEESQDIIYRIRFEGLSLLLLAEEVDEEIRSLLVKMKTSNPTCIIVAVESISSRPQGFAYVDFAEEKQAYDIVRRKGGHHIGGRPLRVVYEGPQAQLRNRGVTVIFKQPL